MHKVNEQIIHTETVYYDNDGNEVARVEQFDAHLYDDSGPLDVSKEEIEDYYT